MINIDKIKGFGQVGHYERNGLYSPEEVLAETQVWGDHVVDFDGDPIRMGSPRYILFKRSLICVRCGLTGLYFAKERAIFLDKKSGRYSPTTQQYHFNLYGINPFDNEVMLTKDHILPRAHGGADEQDNFQVLCAPCNSWKKDRLPTETDEEYYARKSAEKNGIYRENREAKIARQCEQKDRERMHVKLKKQAQGLK